MKKTFLLVLFLCFGAGVSAQDNLIYSTAFPSGGAPFGWTNTVLGFEGETEWYFGDTFMPGTDASFSAPAAIINDDISFDENTYARLQSPVFDTSGYETLTLSFDYSLSLTSDNLGGLNIQVFNGTTWQQILFVNTHTPPVNSGPMDMTQYKNSQFQVRFTYNDEFSSNSWGAGMTNFVLQGTYDVVPNNDITGAFSLGCGQTSPGTTVTSTVKTGLPVCNSVDGNTHGVWYKFYEPMNQSEVTLSLCNSGTDFDSRLSVFKGPDDALTCLTANDNSCGNLSSVVFDYDGFSDYYILVSGEGNTTGNFTISAACEPTPPPNDEIANAIDADAFPQPYTNHAVQFIYATAESQPFDYEVNGCDGGFMPYVWYKFTAAENGTAQVSLTTPSPGDLNLIHFYSAPNENAAIADIDWVNQASNACNAFDDDRKIAVSAGITYYVAITLEGGNSDVVINIAYGCEAPDAPEGSEQQTYTAGETVADLEVEYEDDATLTWYVKNDADEYVAITDDTVLENGTTYYVTQTIEECESGYLGITVSAIAGTGSFAYAGLKVHPNPVSTIITIANGTSISKVVVTNLLGQRVLQREINASDAQLDLSMLQQGTYILQLESEGGASASVKIVKL